MDFKCNHLWPTCVLDFCGHQSISEFTVLRTRKLVILESYFYEEPPVESHDNKEEEISEDDCLLIGLRTHFCSVWRMQRFQNCVEENWDPECIELQKVWNNFPLEIHHPVSSEEE